MSLRRVGFFVAALAVLATVGAFGPSCTNETRSHSSLSFKQAVKDLDCSETALDCVAISGELNDSHLDRLSARRSTLKRVILRSEGGSGFLGMQIGDIILETNSDAYVAGWCSSSCAEFLLPAANRVIAIDEPIVGVHGNPFLVEDLYKRKGIEIPVQCQFRTLDWLRTVYAKKKLQETFFLEEEKRLSLEVDVTWGDDGCPTMSSVSAGQPLWLPTSEEFRTRLGIVIEGTLCRDNEKCFDRLPRNHYLR